MKKLKLQWIIRVAVLACMLGFLGATVSGQVSAQSLESLSGSLGNAGFSVTPPTAYIRIRPGSQATHTITLENTAEQTLTLTPSVVDFTTDGKTGNPVLQNFTTFPYLKFQDGRSLDAGFDPVTLEPGQKAQLTLLIGVPPSAEEREWPLTLLFRASTPVPTTTASGAQLNASIGSNLIVLISSAESLQQSVSLVDLGVPFFADSLRPLSVTPKVKNEQFAATVASGSAQLLDWRGTVVAEQELYPEVILGYSSRNLQGMSVSEGTEQPNATPLRFKPSFFLGMYQVQLVLYNTTGEPKVLGEKTVIAAPFLGLVVVLIMCIVGAIYWRFQEKF